MKLPRWICHCILWLLDRLVFALYHLTRQSRLWNWMADVYVRTCLLFREYP